MNAFQRDFVRDLFDPEADGLLARQPGFEVYRNTIMAGWVDALQANFPSVCAFVGEAWFRAAAGEHARSTPPTEPALVRYGAALPEFLTNFAPAAEMPWLADLARADAMHREALFAADDDTLSAARIAELGPDRLAVARLRPQASARWAWFDTAPIASLWRCHRDARATGVDADLSEIAWRPEGLLLVRQGASVQGWVVDRALVAFLDACARGVALPEAVAAALQAEPAADLSSLMRLAAGAGAFGALALDPDPADGELPSPAHEEILR